MDPAIFPSNSHKVTDPKKNPPKPPAEKKVEKVTTGTVIVKKASLGARFKNVFFGGEFKSATRYITTDVLLPALKNLIVDATTKGVEKIIYGDSAPRRRPQMPGQPRVTYNTPVNRGYDRSNPMSAMLPNQPPHYVGRRQQTVGDIILVSREEAETVLGAMQDIVDQYQVVSIADLHELVGYPSSYIDNTWGWTNLAYSSVRQIREGYVIDLPAAEPF